MADDPITGDIRPDPLDAASRLQLRGLDGSRDTLHHPAVRHRFVGCSILGSSNIG